MEAVTVIDRLPAAEVGRTAEEITKKTSRKGRM
jgi:hypothetical protein